MEFELFLKIIKSFIAIFVVANVVLSLYSNRRRLGFAVSIWKRFRIGMFFEVFGVAVLVVTVFGVLYICIPFLRWGWLNVFVSGGGNIFIAPVFDYSKSSNILLRILVPFFFIMLLIILPFIVKIEEEIFRKGHYRMGEIVWQSVKFGLVHLIVGVPLTGAIAIIGAGFYFACKYRKAFKHALKRTNLLEAEKEALLVSITHHTLYNSILVAFLFILTLFCI